MMKLLQTNSYTGELAYVTCELPCVSGVFDRCTIDKKQLLSHENLPEQPVGLMAGIALLNDGRA